MGKCDRHPKRELQNKTRLKNVKICNGGLTLCSNCEVIRFGCNVPCYFESYGLESGQHSNSDDEGGELLQVYTYPLIPST